MSIAALPTNTCLEMRRLGPESSSALSKFFQELDAAGVGKHFHPHPFDAEQAQRICEYVGRDLYYGLVGSGRIVGYGMLRGWDEGFEIPSLGIAMHPKARGAHLGKMFMLFLHAAARVRGAQQVRLKVYSNNTVARAMYEALGYSFDRTEGDQLVGLVTL